MKRVNQNENLANKFSKTRQHVYKLVAFVIIVAGLSLKY